MRYHVSSLLFAGLALVFVSCGNPSNSESAVKDSIKTETFADTTRMAPAIVTDSVSYSADGKQYTGYIAYDSNLKGKRPIVVVMPEWWGLNDYVKGRARQLAGLGYFAIDADLFGGGKTAGNPPEAMAFTKPYYKNPALTLPAMTAAISAAGRFPQADSSRVGAIGYCFGGFVALNAAKLGAPLKSVVSFHGDLGGLPPKKGILKADILVCQGGADQFVPEAARAAFKKSMDSVGAHYTFIEYPGALHAFSNPAATANGIKYKLPIAYDPGADSLSWKAMDSFFVKTLK